MAITLKSADELSLMREAGRHVGEVLQILKDAVRPGVVVADLDAIVREEYAKRGVTPTFLHYKAHPDQPPYPATVCISVNDQIVHGVPGSRALEPRDVVKLDVTAELDGYIADAAITAVIPPVSHVAEKLVQSSQAAFERAFRIAKSGVRVSELGRQVETEVNRWGFAVIHDMCGHGVGRALHEQPSVPNFFSPFTPGILSDGLVIALEPIICESPTAVFEDDDGWTIRTENGCLAAHYEHTIVIHEGRAEILTAA